MKKILAALLASMLCISMAVPAFAAPTGSQEVGGDNDVKNPIYNYQIPLKIDFAIDAFQKADASGSQVFSADFPIINKSDVALRATVTAKLTEKVADTVTIAETAAAVPQSDLSDTSKAIYMEVVPAKTATTANGASVSPSSTTLKRPVVTTQPTAPAVTFTDGDGTDAAKFVLDLAGAVVANPNTASDAVPYGITVKNASGVLFQLNSAAIAGVAPADTAVGTAFDAKTVKLAVDGGVEETFTAAASTASITLTATNNTPLFATDPTSLTFELTAGKGTDAVVTLDTTTLPTYPTYGVDSTSAPINGADSVAKTTVKAAYGNEIMFVLDKAEYEKDYVDDTEPTLFKAIAANDKGVGAFRLMGTVNPNATWQKEDFKLFVTYDINGVTGNAYSGLDWVTDTTNVAKGAATPSAAGLTADGTVSLAALNVGGKITVPVAYGSGATVATTVSKVEFDATGSGTYTTAATSTHYNLTATPAIEFISGLTTALKPTGKIRVTFDNNPATVIVLTLTA